MYCCPFAILSYPILSCHGSLFGDLFRPTELNGLGVWGAIATTDRPACGLTLYTFCLHCCLVQPIQRKVWRLLTTVFCSGGLLTIIFGVMSFNRIGPNLERSLGEYCKISPKCFGASGEVSEWQPPKPLALRVAVV